MLRPHQVARLKLTDEEFRELEADWAHERHQDRLDSERDEQEGTTE